MWLTGWQYRKQINITGSSGAGTNYQILLKIGESSGASGYDFHLGGHSANFPSGKNQGGDLRFTASNGTTLLNFWVEGVTGTSPNRVAYIWVKVSADLGNNQSIYCYYGNSGASNYSSIQNTFLIGDNFDDNTINTSRWTGYDGRNAITATNQRLEMYNPHTSNDNEGTNPFAHYVVSTQSISSGIAVVEGYIDWTNPTSQEAKSGYALFFSANNFIRVMSRSSGGTLRFTITQGGTMVYNNESSISKARRVRAEYNFSNNEIKFYYQNPSTLAWTLVTTQTYSLGTSAVAHIGTADLTSFNGANTVYIDDVVFRRRISTEPAFNSAGSEETPPSVLVARRGLIMSM